MPTLAVACDTYTSGYTTFMAPRVNTEDLIDATEVARILGFKHRNAVSLYQRRYEDMPRPVVVRANGKIMLWHQPEVVKWGKKTGRTE